MSEHPGFTAPATDPWKGLRGVMAGTLVLEVIVMILTFPVVAQLGGGLTWVSGTYLAVITVLLILACGMQGRARALEMDIGLQFLVIIGGLFHWSIAVIGLIFLFVWLYIRYIRADVARRMREGRLAGQRPIGDGPDPEA
ncbi:DUF4233 domain-containing protein [Gordonia desulfuricans]|uniref:DUF4233 domain-containing protein n=1 Tax=Gordonia desulfuricans TaxID=89051 RepID=A0A7K3LTQ2_9ACTN|nr:MULTISPECIES: DUF4233 domain-containing protein [Gordonia]EMP13877.1 membrane protein [Gordonia sp. NB41Y]NDK91655.1 DUF4233 domain-containing protein [Gordonia desulfuricans]WLP91238.1 DUF4233 domain-containing protein [Gordonia sp. NB41Y]